MYYEIQHEMFEIFSEEHLSFSEQIYCFPNL